MKRLILLIFLGLIPLSLAQAKDATPKSYEQGTLLDIQETKETHTEYVTQRNSDGTTTTKAKSDTTPIYHITVKVGDLVYVGRFKPMWSFSKKPPWIIGDPISVRFEKNKMYLKKPDGKEMKTKIEKRIRASAWPPPR